MKISNNLTKFAKELGLEKTVDILSEAGFEAIDFNTDLLEEYYTDVHDEAFYKNIKAYANSKGVVFAQTHAPYESCFVDEEKTKQRFDEIVTRMKHSAWLGADMVVVHPAMHVDYKDNNYDYLMEYNLAFFKKLIPYAQQYGVKIAIENIPGCISETAEGLLDLIRRLDNEIFTVCYDIGHANICGQDPAEMIRALGTHIGCTHIHDNDGEKDSHTLPYYGNIDWEAVMAAFAEVGYEGNLSYEARRFVTYAPIALRKEGAAYMAQVGKYLVKRYQYYKNLQNENR